MCSNAAHSNALLLPRSGNCGGGQLLRAMQGSKLTDILGGGGGGKGSKFPTDKVPI